ncbi:MAG: LLM class flavin-dependent oxidoreductase [Ilumatobacter sp.]
MARHAIKTPPHHATWSEFLDVWRAADGIDVFESAWTWDHFYPLAEPFDGPNLEGWTRLAALAQATSRIRLGTMVNGMHHRHPAVTANMAATLGFADDDDPAALRDLADSFFDVDVDIVVWSMRGARRRRPSRTAGERAELTRDVSGTSRDSQPKS